MGLAPTRLEATAQRDGCGVSNREATHLRRRADPPCVLYLASWDELQTSASHGSRRGGGGGVGPQSLHRRSPQRYGALKKSAHAVLHINHLQSFLISWGVWFELQLQLLRGAEDAGAAGREKSGR